jgi:hypothetical protein
MSQRIFLVLFFLLFSCVAHTQDDNLKSFDPGKLAAHVQFLADDRLEGRGTGNSGYDLAANYVETQLKKLGLKSAGDSGSYFQKVPFRKTDLVRDQSYLRVVTKKGPVELKFREDFVMSGDYAHTDSSISAGAVFVGFGVTAPELHYDDLAGADLKGKVAVILQGGPSSFPASKRAHYSTTLMKEKNLAEHGAIGYVTVRPPEEAERAPWSRVVRQSALSGYRWLAENGQPSNIFPQLRAHATLNKSGAEILFQGSDPGLAQVFQMLKQQKLKSFPLPVQIQMKNTTKHEQRESSNVIGMLEGSDPELKKEYVVFTAHLDHLGISEPVNGDRINNGAYDNATGCAAVMEIAHAFTALKDRPRRSILFLFVTGEEKGLQGSDYFVNYPTVPIDSIVADINMDMLMMLYPLADAVVLGADHSSLGPIAESALRKMGLKMSPDPAPEEVRFVRSDQYSFIKKGIPSIMFVAGFQSTDPKIDGKAVTKRWLQTIYHSPQDESTQHMDWTSGLKMIEASFLIGLDVANASGRPTWNKGDYFEKRSGR